MQRTMARLGVTPSAVAFGATLTHSFASLLEKDLDTQPVANVHDLIDRCVRSAVDPGMTTYLFGSTAVYGYHEPGTDVDFVVLSKEDVEDGTAADPSSEVAKGIQSDVLAKLARALQEEQGHGGSIWQAELVRRTRVPVLRVKSSSGSRSAPSSSSSPSASPLSSSDHMSSNDKDKDRTEGVFGVDVDITANRRNGVRNSALLRKYFSQQPQTRWLGIAVKQWSKRSGLNMGVVGGCVTSYGFNLMVAYYLLRRDLAKFVPPESCDVAHIAPMPSYMPLAPPTNDGVDLGRMTLDFLEFYAHEFDAETEVVSLRRPGKTLKTDLQWTKQAEDMARISGEKTNYRWCIEDPYEQNLNVGRFVTPFKLLLLRKHLERAKETCLLFNMPPPPPPSSSGAAGKMMASSAAPQAGQKRPPTGETKE